MSLPKRKIPAFANTTWKVNYIKMLNEAHTTTWTGVLTRGKSCWEFIWFKIKIRWKSSENAKISKSSWKKSKRCSLLQTVPKPVTEANSIFNFLRLLDRSLCSTHFSFILKSIHCLHLHFEKIQQLYDNVTTCLVIPRWVTSKKRFWKRVVSSKCSIWFQSLRQHSQALVQIQVLILKKSARCSTSNTSYKKFIIKTALRHINSTSPSQDIICRLFELARAVASMSNFKNMLNRIRFLQRFHNPLFAKTLQASHAVLVSDLQ